MRKKRNAGGVWADEAGGQHDCASARKMLNMKRIIQFIIVGIILAASYATFVFVHPENWINNNETISASDIAQKPMADYEGKMAGEGIVELQNADAFHALKTYDYVVVSPQNVIGTGVYELKRWVDPNDLKKGILTNGRTYTSGQTVPNVVTNAVQAALDYNEYYMIQLPDGSHILALFDSRYADSIAQGESVTLPIGRRLQTAKDALAPLRSVCGQYDVDTSDTLYAFDDAWQESNQNTVFWIKLAFAGGAFLALTVVSAILFKKIFA